MVINGNKIQNDVKAEDEHKTGGQNRVRIYSGGKNGGKEIFCLSICSISNWFYYNSKTSKA